MNSERRPFDLQNIPCAQTDSVDAARHILFSNTSKTEAMSPSSDALRFHLMRVYYQAMVWRNAHCAVLELPAPVDMGWKHGDSGLQTIIMSLSPIQECCLEMISCSCQKQCRTRLCKCRKSGLRCTAMRACYGLVQQTVYSTRLQDEAFMSEIYCPVMPV